MTPPMRLGFVSAILPEMDLREILHVAREIGYDCVEVMCWPSRQAERRYAGVSHLDVGEMGPEKVAAVQELVRESGVAVSGLGYYPNPLSPDENDSRQIVDHLTKVIRATAALGLKHCNTFVGRDWRLTVEENWPRFLEVWRPLVKLAEELQVYLGIENCPMLFSRDEWPGGKNLAISPRVWRKMFQDLQSPYFGLNYDPSHLVWQQIDYLAPIREFGSRIFHVHAKDMRVDRHLLNEIGILGFPPEYHIPKIPGLGDVDWGAFISLLTDIGFQGSVCVEVEDRAFEHSTEGRLRSLRQSHTYLRNFIPR